MRLIGCHFVTAVALEVKVNFDEFEIHKIIQTFGFVMEPPWHVKVEFELTFMNNLFLEKFQIKAQNWSIILWNTRSWLG